MKRLVVVAIAFASLVQAETIDVPCGQTRSVDAGRRFAGGVLVKTGGGVLDLTGAVLANAGLEIREGAVRMVAGDHATVTTGDGLLDIKLHTANDITKALISAFFIGVKEIEKQYPANVRVLSEP